MPQYLSRLAEVGIKCGCDSPLNRLGRPGNTRCGGAGGAQPVGEPRRWRIDQRELTAWRRQASGGSCDGGAVFCYLARRCPSCRFHSHPVNHTPSCTYRRLFASRRRIDRPTDDQPTDRRPDRAGCCRRTPITSRLARILIFCGPSPERYQY